MSAVRDSIGDLCPEVIGISVRNIDDQVMESPQFLLPPVREVVATCRRMSGAPIVLGGAGYSIFPESALRYLGANMGIRGEGETTFPAVLERVARRAPVSGLPGLYLPGQPPTGRSFVTNLDDLPLPDARLFVPSLSGSVDFWVPVQSRRGCPMDCSFCSTSAIEGRSIRRHSPDTIKEWLEHLLASGSHNFHFVDNTFNLSPAYAKELCRKILERGLDIKPVVHHLPQVDRSRFGATDGARRLPRDQPRVRKRLRPHAGKLQQEVPGRRSENSFEDVC